MKSFSWSVPRLRIATFIGILHLLIVVLGAGVISGVALFFIYQNGVQSNLREMEGLAFVLANSLEEPVQALQSGEQTAQAIDQTLQGYIANRPSLQFTILAPDGSLLLPASEYCSLEGITLDSPEVREAQNHTIGRAIRSCPRGKHMMLVAATISHSGSIDATLVLAAPFHEGMVATYRSMAAVCLAAILIVAVTVAEGWLGSIYISRPLANLSSVAEQFSQGNLQARAALGGPLEIYHLAQTFNVMATRLQNSLESMRTFVANASHELRTPLTTLKLQVGALQSGACEDPEVAHRFLDQIESEVDRMTHSVNEMLDLSQIESDVHPEMQPVDLKELAREALAFWETRSREAGLTIELICAPTLPMLPGDPFQLRRLLDNLLDNAIKNTPSGGKINVNLECCTRMHEVPQQKGVQIAVRDTGRGIAAEHLPFIFDRFYRIPQAGSPQTAGSGLGLAIARSIVRYHGGEIYVESQIDTGTTFTVLLPVQ